MSRSLFCFHSYRQILDASNLIYSSESGTAVLPKSRPRQTTLTFSQGHLNIVKSTLGLRVGEFFFYSQALHILKPCVLETSSGVTTSTDKGDEGDPGTIPTNAETDIHTTSSAAANTHKNMSPSHPIYEDEDMDDVTIYSNQNHGDHHNNDGTNGTNEMHTNTNMTTNEGDGGSCLLNEDCLGKENMENRSNHQDSSQGK